MSRFHCLAMQINRRSAGVGGENTAVANQDGVKELVNDLKKAHQNSLEAGMLAVVALVISGIALIIRLL